MAASMDTHLRDKPNARAACRGASLVELLLVTTIVGVLIGLALPSLGAMLQAQKSITVANRFLGSLHFARSEAIKRNARVVVCKSADGLLCSSVGAWDQGWLVFHDRDNNAQRSLDEDLVQTHLGSADGLRLSGNGPVANYVSYAANGRARTIQGAFQAGTVTLCPTMAGGAVRRIIIGAPGRPRLEQGSPADCP